MPIYQFKNLTPNIDPDTFIFDSADIIGDVHLAAGVSIWSNVAIRGDNARITIGEGSNVQESSVLHVDEGVPLNIGRRVTVGHQAMLHGCTIQDGALIGMQAIVLNHAVVGRNCLIGAGAIIPEGREIPDGSLVVGVGKILRQLSDEEIQTMHANTQHYIDRGHEYKRDLVRLA
ncbi:gamma carbonic anhydrase family protein [Neopusillimonas maritima]|jgi:carbonic anhydrase/acetyltransferase-like protein (isoleucine patch superfamily)|uniref:Gamma carbonic anhydrase family protein n=1 Tax=Neopusillimonas maritima TaxID=2026239 RepID=A0A3A1YWS2_9BURK|nr:gamma carbonic anhydrase family protein [Neopusillimonas maritima]RII84072.1 gamma carbonic anhydrase family protein [Neopusillimonas maritima]RIY40924.1 gamma carbonic anhydrase family protein [Neopusillimonas maritima]|tara:strand:- start:2055 stop:2576 length:522 start_codon:yes stop_codon:yes gene_type:complete